MSHRLIQQLREVRNEYDGARVALAYVAKEWPRIHADTALSGPEYADVHRAKTNLEATYTLRLFAEFEAILRAQYPHSRRRRAVPANSAALIDGLGAQYVIPQGIRADVHREYRHNIAHADYDDHNIALVDAHSALNRFLAYIDDIDVPE
jgi:hypothetical protein